jgi:hypothetical protein
VASRGRTTERAGDGLLPAHRYLIGCAASPRRVSDPPASASVSPATSLWCSASRTSSESCYVLGLTYQHGCALTLSLCQDASRRARGFCCSTVGSKGVHSTSGRRGRVRGRACLSHAGCGVPLDSGGLHRLSQPAAGIGVPAALRHRVGRPKGQHRVCERFGMSGAWVLATLSLAAGTARSPSAGQRDRARRVALGQGAVPFPLTTRTRPCCVSTATAGGVGSTRSVWSTTLVRGGRPLPSRCLARCVPWNGCVVDSVAGKGRQGQAAPWTGSRRLRWCLP